MESPRLDERVVALVGENHVVDDMNPHHIACVDHACGEHEVVWARRGVAGWMIVKEDDGCRRGRRRFSEHFARVDDGRVEGTDRHDLDPDQPVLRIEHDDPELLDNLRAVLREQVGRKLTGAAEDRPLGNASDECSASELDGSNDLRGARCSDASHSAKLAYPDTRQPVEPTGAIEQTIGELERIGLPRSASQHQCEQLVVPEPCWSEPFQLFTRAIVRRDSFHFIYTQFQMRRWLPRAGATAWLVAALVASSCASPPNKEIDQAQGAIDAARATGAEKYAQTEYTAAVTALKQANDAVTQRDYRLALSYALESREHAQNAARDAADTRARIRGDVERLMAEVTALRMQVNTRLTAAQNTSSSRARLRTARQTLAQITKELQETGELMKQGDYDGAQPKLNGLKSRLEKLNAAITAATAPRRVRAAGVS